MIIVGVYEKRYGLVKLSVCFYIDAIEHFFFNFILSHTCFWKLSQNYSALFAVVFSHYLVQHCLTQTILEFCLFVRKQSKQKNLVAYLNHFDRRPILVIHATSSLPKRVCFLFTDACLVLLGRAKKPFFEN